jgi:hypothetical protein
MKIENFERRIQHLDQTQILSGVVSSLNKLLVDKGLAKPEEIQGYFLQWMREQNLTKAMLKKSKTKQ